MEALELGGVGFRRVEVDARHIGDDPMRMAIIAALLREKGYLLDGAEDMPSTTPPADMRWGRG